MVASTDTEGLLRRYKEIIAGVVSAVVLLCFAVLVGFAIWDREYDEKDHPQYRHEKDLLIFVNPILGVVLGYYFGKNPAEVRAEKAESRESQAAAIAEKAVANAQDATIARRDAEGKFKETASALQDLLEPAQALVGKVGTTRGLQDRGSEADLTELTIRLESAVQRAKTLIEK